MKTVRVLVIESWTVEVEDEKDVHDLTASEIRETGSLVNVEVAHAEEV